jgi:uncharacterized Fe-S cluster-containing radical SAM superfamily protein
MSPAASRPEGHPATCSAKGCRADAVYGLLWNNPKLHTPERRKAWMACEEHAGSLAGYLSKRGFLKDSIPVSEMTDEMG